TALHRDRVDLSQRLRACRLPSPAGRSEGGRVDGVARDGARRSPARAGRRTSAHRRGRRRLRRRQPAARCGVHPDGAPLEPRAIECERAPPAARLDRLPARVPALDDGRTVTPTGVGRHAAQWGLRALLALLMADIFVVAPLAQGGTALVLLPVIHSVVLLSGVAIALRSRGIIAIAVDILAVAGLVVHWTYHARPNTGLS